MAHGPEGILYAPGGPFTQPVDPCNAPTHWDDNGAVGPSAGEDAGILETEHVQSKKEKQWTKWEEETIPMLLHPYIHLLHETESLQNLSTLRQSSCPSTCPCVKPRLLKVTCIFFERKDYLLSGLYVSIY